MRDTTTYCGDDGALCQHTDLQSRLRNIHKDHYQIYPDHCDLVHGMLEINHKRRFRCDQILEIITEKCTCPDRRKHRRLQVRQQSQDELQQSQDEQLMEAIFTNMPVSSTPSNFVEEAIIPVFVDQSMYISFLINFIHVVNIFITIHCTTIICNSVILLCLIVLIEAFHLNKLTIIVTN